MTKSRIARSAASDAFAQLSELERGRVLADFRRQLEYGSTISWGEFLAVEMSRRRRC